MEIVKNCYVSWVQNVEGNCLSYVRHAMSEIETAKCKHSGVYKGEILLHCETLDSSQANTYYCSISDYNACSKLVMYDTQYFQNSISAA